MRSQSGSNSMLLYIVLGLEVGIVALAVKYLLPEDNYFYSFLIRAWPIQLLNTWLFSIAILFWFQRYSLFRKEEKAFEKVKLPEYLISHEDASKIIRSMPTEHGRSLTLRRIRELLQAFIYREDIIRLNEELSQRDMAEVERGHLILNSLRSIVPVIGFLGTVIGLSTGMLKFPEVTDIFALRAALKGFAASMSFAFDTTLLALGYTVALILMTSFLRHREELLVSRVDERARVLVGQIKADGSPQPFPADAHARPAPADVENTLSGIQAELSSTITGVFEKIHDQNHQLIEGIEKSVSRLSLSIDKLTKNQNTKTTQSRRSQNNKSKNSGDRK
ncbi:hypothetical protein CEE37_14425 [candidate division LCP-89 bacterium B3_LCP]|uniref:MotA/TolQ/ExbB proton channel domain-containing protein n=1 Tax=candidate division LCP-89 bacterium B3_LCP TaxID=2012998 RepID=A0A532UQ28_UNCL8|nr:MAG: hypothetical protein CEE37_14425 [candidate division LCP-89 bacterium B3_LCP]